MLPQHIPSRSRVFVAAFLSLIAIAGEGRAADPVNTTKKCQCSCVTGTAYDGQEKFYLDAANCSSLENQSCTLGINPQNWQQLLEGKYRQCTKNPNYKTVRDTVAPRYGTPGAQPPLDPGPKTPSPTQKGAIPLGGAPATLQK